MEENKFPKKAVQQENNIEAPKQAANIEEIYKKILDEYKDIFQRLEETD